MKFMGHGLGYGLRKSLHTVPTEAGSAAARAPTTRTATATAPAAPTRWAAGLFLAPALQRVLTDVAKGRFHRVGLR